MANDLISRSDAIKRAKAAENKMSSINGIKVVPMGSVIQFLEIVPTVDAVVIPCKIGDTVWAVRSFRDGKKHAMQGVVSEMSFVGSEMRISIAVKGVCRGEWGKTIFATQEDAEAEIARRRGNDGK